MKISFIKIGSFTTILTFFFYVCLFTSFRHSIIVKHQSKKLNIFKLESSLNPTVWSVFGDLAKSTNSINLGQGFPDWDPPEFVMDAYRSVALGEHHQYSRPFGHLALVKQLSQRYSAHLKRVVDPLNEVVITVGASQALYLALTSMLSQQDEIIIFEPFFELYIKQVKLTGAKPIFVRLGGNSSKPSNPWALDLEALKRAITPKTKVILLNSPHNPTGKVFLEKELHGIAEIVKMHPHITVISDEVYKFTIYDPIEPGDESVKGHYHFARIPGMWDRTITISSSGKTFSITGWQIGWMVGPQKYIHAVQNIIPSVQFCSPSPLQEALSVVIKNSDRPYFGFTSYYEWLRKQYLGKRLILEKGLKASGISTLPSNGGFFIMGKLPSLEKISFDATAFNEEYDWTFCKNLAMRKRVVGIPASPFFSSKQSLSEIGPLARFAFCKKDETLTEACARLEKADTN